jgi:hypothetical protein
MDTWRYVSSQCIDVKETTAVELSKGDSGERHKWRSKLKASVQVFPLLSVLVFAN